MQYLIYCNLLYFQFIYNCSRSEIEILKMKRFFFFMIQLDKK